MGKPGYPTVARHVVPTDGATADELFDHLVAASVEQGWEQTLTSTDLYRATKSLDSGARHLLIAVHDEFQPARVIVSVSVM